MPPQHEPAFREGLAGLLARWTALQLAITNEWGGSESVQKGEQAVEELGDWFLKRKGGKHAEDLEELLVEILGDDFNVQCEDGSPREVARVACQMYEQVAQGEYALARDICSKPLPREHLAGDSSPNPHPSPPLPSFIPSSTHSHNIARRVETRADDPVCPQLR